jgi:hypothetical protein
MIIRVGAKHLCRLRLDDNVWECYDHASVITWKTRDGGGTNLNFALEIEPRIFIKAYKRKSKRRVIFTDIFTKRAGLRRVFSYVYNVEQLYLKSAP